MTITAEQAAKLLEGTTPGPWYWEETHPTNACANVLAKSEDGYGREIASLYGGSDSVPAPTMPDEPWGDHPIRRANARLTAAAPDLAAALIASEAARKLAEERLAKAVEALQEARDKAHSHAHDGYDGVWLESDFAELTPKADAILKEIGDD